MADDAGKRDVERVSTLRDGAVSVAACLALAAANLLYVLPDVGFTQPATWVRIIILVVTGVLTTLAWAIWLRGKPIRDQRHFMLPVGVALGTATMMYVGAALFVIDQREEPIDVTFSKEMAGREQVVLGKKARSLLEAQLLQSQGIPLERDGFDAEYEFYRDPERPRSDYVVVMVVTADKGSPAADSLADDFDDQITGRLLSRATGVGESQPIAGAPGRMRCGTVVTQGERTPLCVFAHGVRSVMVIMPPGEANPEDLATDMLAEMLST